ncbi:hypothetical protein VNO77_40404 [Canavalia gladiata]|uniref:Uncharacterized protein n=1 Tax=Canavalia gladiata TaxID=3824 RepID=A0AAN9JYT3_CANGL
MKLQISRASLTESFPLTVDQSTEWLENNEPSCMRVIISFSLFREKKKGKRKHFNSCIDHLPVLWITHHLLVLIDFGTYDHDFACQADPSYSTQFL